MDKIKRYKNSHREGPRVFAKTVLLTLLCIGALVCGFVGAAFLSGRALF